MPEFRYQGKTLENKKVQGTMVAKSASGCYAALKEQNIYAYDVAEKGAGSTRVYKLKATELAEFSRQIGTMQNSGIPMVRALDILKERVTKAKVLRVYDNLAQLVSGGNTLSEAMHHCNGAFPPMMIHMFQAGEANGRLDDAAVKMAKYYDSEHKIRGKIKSAMIYPAILGVVTVAVIVILFTFVLPQIFELIADGGGELTGLTKVMITISDVLVHQWYLVILVVAVLVIIVHQLLQKFRPQVDRYKLKLPKFGRLLSIIYTATFARTLSSLYGSGVSMLEAVTMSAKTIGNQYIAEQFITVTQKVQNGSSLSTAIDGLEGLERKLVSTIYVGEETGRLEFMLNQISQEYEYESETAIARMLTFVEPAMLVVMGLIIGLVLISVMGPMTQMYGAIG